MSEYRWLLVVHIAGAFMFLSGSVAIAALQLEAMRRQRPSEIAFLLGLARTQTALIGIGGVIVLVFGIWLAHDAGYGVGAGWVVAAIVLWVVSGVLGGVGGARSKRVRVLAQRLASEADTTSAELTALLRDRTTAVLNWGSGVLVLAILGLMVWKP